MPEDQRYILLFFYGVFWALALGTLGKFRAFNTAAIFPLLPDGWKGGLRWIVSVTIANGLPVLILAWLYAVSDGAHIPNGWAIVASALAAFSTFSIHRFVHAAIATEKSVWFYPDWEWIIVREKLYPEGAKDPQTFWSHFGWGLFYLFAPLHYAVSIVTYWKHVQGMETNDTLNSVDIFGSGFAWYPFDSQETLSAALVIVTVLYVVLTFRILQANRQAVQAMERQVVAATRPYLQFDIIVEGQILESSLRNTGLTAAHNIMISTTPPMRIHAADNSSEPSRLVGTIIPSLAPGRDLREGFGVVSDMETWGSGTRLEVVLNYEDSTGSKYKENLVLDPGQVFRLPYWSRPSVEREVGKISKELAVTNKMLEGLFRKMNPK